MPHVMRQSTRLLMRGLRSDLFNAGTDRREQAGRLRELRRILGPNETRRQARRLAARDLAHSRGRTDWMQATERDALP